MCSMWPIGLCNINFCFPKLFKTVAVDIKQTQKTANQVVLMHLYICSLCLTNLNHGFYYCTATAIASFSTITLIWLYAVDNNYRIASITKHKSISKLALRCKDPGYVCFYRQRANSGFRQVAGIQMTELTVQQM